jgi:ubiquinone/menaquinone biosynthesis C-methylase UbiE
MYLMEDPAEGHRLEAKTDDALSEQNLKLAGLESWMSAIDVGCGSGAVTRTIASITAGEVKGLDMSLQRLSFARELAERYGKRVQFLQGTAEQIPLDDDIFDFCWCRFMFEYQLDPMQALQEMVRIAKPGGLVAVADLDGQMTAFYPQPDPIRSQFTRALQLLSRTGFDAEVGRKLYSMFLRAGLRRVRVHVLPYQIYCGGLEDGPLSNWIAKMKMAVESLMVLDPTTDWHSFSEEVLELMRRKDSFYYSIMILTVGIKPTEAL